MTRGSTGSTGSTGRSLGGGVANAWLSPCLDSRLAWSIESASRRSGPSSTSGSSDHAAYTPPSQNQSSRLAGAPKKTSSFR